jgi:putative membrane protein
VSDEGWRRFHPLSPLLRGGIAMGAVAAYVVSNQFDTWFGADSQLPAGTPLQWIALATLAVVAAMVLLFWLSWRVSRFRIGASTLEVRTGLLFRQHREVRYDRIQAVDLRRPLLARLAGLSEVRVQAAGGSGSDARLAFLREREAHEVRARLMDLAGRSDERPAATAERAPVDPTGETAAGSPAETPVGTPAGGAVAGPPPVPLAETVVRVPAARLVQAALFSGRTLFLLAAVPTLLAGLALGRSGLVAVLGPAVLGVGGNAFRDLARQWNFALVRDGDGIHVRRGLTELKSSSVPVHRLQAVSVRQPAFWRLTDWWRIEVNVAGVGPGADNSDSVLLPVGTRAEAMRVLTVLRPGADSAPVLAGMVGDADAAYVVAPARAAWLSPLVRTRHGYAVTPDALLVRGGRVRRFVDVVPHARIQSLRLRQGPVQRRLRLATVEVLSTPGTAEPRVRHLAVGDASALLNEQVLRSSRARQPVR